MHASIEARKAYQRRYYAERSEEQAEAIRKRNAAWQRQWRKEHPLASNQKQAAAYAKHREDRKIYNQVHRERYWAAHVMRKYGITIEQYEAMLALQGGVCAICEQPESKVVRGHVCHLHVDHDHATGTVRQLLCHNCNVMLGLAGDSIKRLESGLAYLRRHQQIGEQDGDQL